jgi:cytochrome c oxidase assembly factor CtaG/putative copper export protein
VATKTRTGRWSLIVALAAAGAALVVIAVSRLAGATPYLELGTDDPGGPVRLLDPLLRLILDAAATVCTGSLVFAAFFTRPQRSGLISPPAFAALRTATRAAIVWSLAALALWPVDIAATVGLPLRQVLSLPGLVAATRVSEGPKAWLITVAITAGLAVACRLTLRWPVTFGLAAVAVLALLPVITAGHSASDTGHDLATTAIAIHIPAAVVWLGTLIALVRSRGMGEQWLPAAHRYARLAAGCWGLVAFSGLVDAAVLAPGSSPFTTGYGALLLAKAAILAGLGVALACGRRRALAGGPALRRLLVFELVALAAAFGASVGLVDLLAPKFIGRPVSGDESLLGYNLSGAPTLARLVTDWRIEVLFAPLALLLATLYLIGVRRLGRRWPPGRTASWLAGCAVLLVATSSGLGRYAPAMFSVQAVAHLLVGMLAPLLFALGAPLTLAGAVLRPAPEGSLPGPREWLDIVRTSRPVRTLTEPVVATVLFAGSPFVLYFTDLYDVTARFHWAHLAMDLIFLVIGYFFAWSVVGGDPTPRPAASLLRIGLILVAMPLDVLFAAGVLASRHLIGDGSASADLYRALALPWVPSLAADQRLGAYLALAVGEAVMLAALAVVVVRWRPAEPDSDYQQLLETLSRRRAERSALDLAEAAQPQAVGHDEQR